MINNKVIVSLRTAEIEIPKVQFDTMLQCNGFAVDSKDYSDEGLYGITHHLMEGDRVVGQVWYSQQEKDEYMKLNKDAW